MIRNLLIVLAMVPCLALAKFDRASVHEQIENCPVTSDARCLKDILHALAANTGGGGSGSVLVAGIYEKVSTGGPSFCPQQIAPQIEGGILKYTVSYIEGCSLTETFSCVSTICQNEAKSRTITITGPNTYNFNEQGSGNSDFRRRG